MSNFQKFYYIQQFLRQSPASSFLILLLMRFSGGMGRWNGRQIHAFYLCAIFIFFAVGLIICVSIWENWFFQKAKRQRYNGNNIMHFL